MKGESAVCEGSGVKPREIGTSLLGVAGRCPICRRWIMLTKRTEVLHRHTIAPKRRPGFEPPASSPAGEPSK